jgi:hypothetical protein
LGEVGVYVLRALDNFGEEAWEVVYAACYVGVENVSRGIDARSWALPSFHLRILRSHIEMECVFLIFMLLYYRQRILFLEPRKIQKVRVLVELVEDGARGILQVIRSEDGYRVRRKLFGEVCAALVIL